MKILFVTNCYPTKNNPEYGIFTKEQIESVLAHEGIEGDIFFINAREKGALEYLRAIIPLYRKLKKYDFVHAFHSLTFILVSLLSPQKTTVVSFLLSIEDEFREKNLISFFLKKLTLKFIKRKNVTKIFKDKIPSDLQVNSYYLPNGVDLNKFYPIEKSKAKTFLNLDIDKKYILFVSSKNKYRKQKRYDRFLEVMEILKKEYPDIEELVLINEPRDKIPYYFNASEFHLLTSDYEGSPNSVKEALACNVPVVATNTGNVKEMIENVDGCYISYSFSSKEMAAFSSKILENNQYGNNIRNAIIDKKLDIFSKSVELINIYKNALSSNS